MSINDKVQVLWKTNCEWRDHPHWPKRREIKLRQGDSAENSILPLKPGDWVRIKFGSRWYDAEVAEHWNPKSKKAKTTRPTENKGPATLSVKTPTATEGSATSPAIAQTTSEKAATPAVNDPYEHFLAEQKERELAWKTQRTVKKARLESTKNSTTIEEPTIEISDAGNESVDQVSRLQQQLDAKTDECCRLRSQLVKLKEDNAETVRAHLESQKRLFKMMEAMHDSVKGIEEKMSAAFTKIDDRLESLEVQTAGSCSLFNGSVNYGAPNNANGLTDLISQPSLSKSDDLPTIDAESLATVCGDPTFPEAIISTLNNPATPLQQRVPAAATPSPSRLTESQLADVRPELSPLA